MTPQPLSTLARIALKAIRAGEHELLRRYKRLQPQEIGFKAHHEIVTAADHASNEAIIRVLRRHTPEFDILSEEHAPRRRSNCVWILDPLDGTTNYTAQIPLWGISLALTCDHEIEIGVISLPFLGERYLTIRENGAWQMIGKRRKTISVSRTNKLKDALGLLCYGNSCGERDAGATAMRELNCRSRSMRRFGAAVIEAMWVATGRADYAILYGIRPWDIAAGALLVKEAGGVVTQPNGASWKLGCADVLFAAPGILKKILHITTLP